MSIYRNRHARLGGRGKGDARYPRLPSDPPELLELIDWLINVARLFVDRPQTHQLKIAYAISYYPGKGTIVPDGQSSLAQKGPYALKSFLRRRFPHKFLSVPHDVISIPRDAGSASQRDEASTHAVASPPWDQNVEAVYLELMPEESKPEQTAVLLEETYEAPNDRKDLKDLEI